MASSDPTGTSTSASTSTSTSTSTIAITTGLAGDSGPEGTSELPSDGCPINTNSNSNDCNTNSNSNTKRPLNAHSRRNRRIKQRKASDDSIIGELLAAPDKGLSRCQRRSGALSGDALVKVTEQLGYLPANIVSVAAEVKGEPAVAQLYPLNTNSLRGRYSDTAESTNLPFPTTFWMTNPQLLIDVAELEREGLIKTFQVKLNESPQFLAQMKQAHEAYAAERWGLLSEADKQYIEDHGWTSALKDTGVAGIHAMDSVKCLHCHYSHYLARPEHGNIIGSWVHDALIVREGQQSD